MKLIFKSIAIAIALLAQASYAGTALDALNIETINQTMTTAEIRTTLDDWKTEALSRVEQRVEFMSDRAPYLERKQYVTLRIEQEYKKTFESLNL